MLCSYASMELRHLRYFVVSAEEENFHRAAARLFVAQTAISRRIKDLETELGVRLFDRNRQRVTLSQAGRIYLTEISRALKEIDHAGEKARLISKGEVSSLTLGFHETAIRGKIVEMAFQDFRSKYPHVELKLDPLLPEPLVDAVLHGRADAALLFGDCFSAITNVLEVLEVAELEYVLALPRTHTLAKRKKLRLRDLEDVGFVWSRRDTSPTTQDRLIAACNAGGLTPRIVQHAPTENTRMQLVTMGIGVAFVLSSNLEHNSSRLVFRRVEDFYVPMRLYLAWRAENTSSTLQRFADGIRALRCAPSAQGPGNR